MICVVVITEYMSHEVKVYTALMNDRIAVTLHFYLLLDKVQFSNTICK